MIDQLIIGLIAAIVILLPAILPAVLELSRSKPKILDGDPVKIDQLEREMCIGPYSHLAFEPDDFDQDHPVSFERLMEIHRRRATTNPGKKQWA